MGCGEGSNGKSDEFSLGHVEFETVNMLSKEGLNCSREKSVYIYIHIYIYFAYYEWDLSRQNNVNLLVNY